VTVSFRMDSDGKITAIIDVKNTSSDQGKEACISAITARSPYGKWSDDMIAVLGESQEMTFTFTISEQLGRKVLARSAIGS